MLVLSRKVGESIILNGDIEIKVVQSDDGKVKLGISAPKEIEIFRKELYDQIIEENKKAKESKGRLSSINKNVLNKLNKDTKPDSLIIKK